MAVQCHRKAAAAEAGLEAGPPEVEAAESLGPELHVLGLKPPIDLGAGERLAKQVTSRYGHGNALARSQSRLRLEDNLEGVGLEVLHLEGVGIFVCAQMESGGVSAPRCRRHLDRDRPAARRTKRSVGLEELASARVNAIQSAGQARGDAQSFLTPIPHQCFQVHFLPRTVNVAVAEKHHAPSGLSLIRPIEGYLKAIVPSLVLLQHGRVKVVTELDGH